MKHMLQIEKLLTVSQTNHIAMFHDNTITRKKKNYKTNNTLIDFVMLN